MADTDTNRYYCASNNIKVYPAGYRSASIDIEASRTTEGSVRKQSNAPLFKTSYAKTDGNGRLIFVLDGYVAEIADIATFTTSIISSPTSGDSIYAVLSTHKISGVKIDSSSTNEQSMVMMVGDATTDSNIIKTLDETDSTSSTSSFKGIYFTSSKPSAGTYIEVLTYTSGGWKVPKASRLNIATAQISDAGGDDADQPISEQFTTGKITAGSVSVTDALGAGSADVSGKITAGSVSVTDALGAGSMSVGSANVAGNLTSKGDVTVAGETNVNGAFTAKNVNVTGLTTVGETLTAKAGLESNGKVDVQSGGLTVSSGGVSVSGATSVTGEAKFNGGLTASGAVTVSGTSTFQKTLTANAGATVNEKLTVRNGTLSVGGNADVSSLSVGNNLGVTNNLTVTGNNTTDSGGVVAAARVGALKVSNTLYSGNTASAGNLDVKNKLSVTGDDPDGGAAATAGTLAVGKTLKSSGGATAKYLTVSEGTLSVTGSDPTNAKAAYVNALTVNNGTLSVGDGGASTKTLSTPSLTADGSVSVTGTGSLNYSGISSAATSNNKEDKPVWISKGTASSSDKGIPTIAEGLKYNPQTQTLTAKNLSGNASTADKFASDATVELRGDVTGSVSSTCGWTITTNIAAGAVGTTELADNAVTAAKLGSVIATNGGMSTKNGMTVTLSQTDSKGGLSIGISGDKVDSATSADSATTASKVTVATSSSQLYLLGATSTTDSQECYTYSDGKAYLTSNGYLHVGNPPNYSELRDGSIYICNSGNSISLNPGDADNLFHISKGGDTYALRYTASGSFGLYNNNSPKFSVTSAGAVTAASYNATSDLRLKENISDYRCDKSILDLPIKRFDFIDGPKNQIGCIAQDLQKICPEIVHENSDGYLSIQESKIVYLLLEEVKKLREEVDELKEAR